MSGQSLDPEAPIWPFLFGKMPAHGDFISRGLDDETIELGDAVIAEALALALGRWDAEWDDVYVETPVWRFVATPGVLGRHWLTGVFLPSVDAVGRQFPLIAGYAGSTLALLADPVRTNALLDEAEATTRTALVDGLSVDTAMEQLSTAAQAGFRDIAACDDVLRHFAHQTLSALESTPWSPESRWWIVGGGDADRLEHQGPLAAEAIAILFRRMPVDTVPDTSPAPGEAESNVAPDPSVQTEDKTPQSVVSCVPSSGEQTSEAKS